MDMRNIFMYSVTEHNSICPNLFTMFGLEWVNSWWRLIYSCVWEIWQNIPIAKTHIHNYSVDPYFMTSFFLLWICNRLLTCFRILFDRFLSIVIICKHHTSTLRRSAGIDNICNIVSMLLLQCDINVSDKNINGITALSQCNECVIQRTLVTKPQ